MKAIPKIRRDSTYFRSHVNQIDLHAEHMYLKSLTNDA